LTADDFLGVPSYQVTNRLVGTYFFYWYNAKTKSHIIDPDGTDALTTHPVSLEDYSYDSVRWHREQLTDMIAAGIDVVLPVFWGAPSERDPRATLHWSYVGLPKLVQAREELLREGKNPPRIGLFYDTSTLQFNSWHRRIDCTTDYGREWFYATVRDFFSLVPPRHWAMIEGKPIVLLYSAAFAIAHDQRVIDHCREQFAREFGGRTPWIAREVSWNVKADATVAWGGALGLRNPGVAALGPGYDHSAVPGREPLVVERREGRFYEENWLRFLRRPANFVMVETWNEFHEGTDIANSREYGRKYIGLTRKYADLFRQGHRPSWPAGLHHNAPSVSVVLGTNNVSQGLRQMENEDGQTIASRSGQREGRQLAQTGKRNPFIYFQADDSFKWAELMSATVTVEYFDASQGSLALDYDGNDSQAAFAGAYTRCPVRVVLTGDQRWKTARFPLVEARLVNGQNRGADFRLVVEAPQCPVARVTLERIR
jgi:hypothetical protein